MAEEIKCPICGKVGIPNYLDEDISCPCCGSDLSIFRVINQLPQAKSDKKNIWKPISAVAILATAALGFILLFSHEQPQQNTTPTSDAELITNLQDSINTLNSKLANINSPINNDGFKYVIRKGDSPWLISRRVYGTGTRYQEIMDANGMTLDTKLIVGDTIIIK